MAAYRLVFRRSVSKDLRGIPEDDLRRILARIEALAEDPRGRGCEKLSGAERWRARQGRYRVLYEIHDDEETVVVVKVGHRRHVYRGT